MDRFLGMVRIIRFRAAKGVPEKPNVSVDLRFGLYEPRDMKIATFRKDVLGLSQEEFARRIGLKSKGQVSEIERDNKCSAKVALEIERISEGQISAATICPAVALVRGDTPRQASSEAA